MEDTTPPADADGPPPGAGGGAVPTAWVEALQRHTGWLRRVVSTRVGEPQAVDEVMQEVSLAVALSPDARAAGHLNPAAWLYRVAVRQALLYRRKSGRRRKLLDAFAARAAAAGGAREGDEDPLRWLISHERDALVRLAVARLPRRDADVLVLKYTEQWSYRQLAEHLGLSESAVEARLHRARRRLRDELARLDVSEDTA